MIKDKTTITHMGKTFTTTHFMNISDEHCDELRREYYTKPSIDKVQIQMNKLINGGKLTNVIHSYYFKYIMAKCVLITSKWSIEEFFECNDLIRFAYAKMKNCNNFYLPKYSDIKNIESVLRCSPSGTAAKVSNFPYKTINDILETYNINNKYYDYSCGWGVRMMSAIVKNIDYYGTDTNHELVDALNECSEEFHKFGAINNQCDIRSQGSETFVVEWENTIGLAFSSPPYFDLEDYRVGEQSIDVHNTYNKWLEDYWRATIKNISRYLIDDGILGLNIKNGKTYALLDDMMAIIEEEGFVLLTTHELKNINRQVLRDNNKNTNEQILIFKKCIV